MSDEFKHLSDEELQKVAKEAYDRLYTALKRVDDEFLKIYFDCFIFNRLLKKRGLPQFDVDFLDERFKAEKDFKIRHGL